MLNFSVCFPSADQAATQLAQEAYITEVKYIEINHTGENNIPRLNIILNEYFNEAFALEQVRYFNAGYYCFALPVKLVESAVSQVTKASGNCLMSQLKLDI